MNVNELIQKCRLTSAEADEFAEYLRNRFSGVPELQPGSEEFIKPWERLAALSGFAGAANIINQKLCPKFPVDFKEPDGVQLYIYDSFAGRIPIVSASDKSDFEALVTNIVYKGSRPGNIEKTGASFVFGSTARFIILSAKPYSNVRADELGLGDSEWMEKSLLLRRSHECVHFYTKQVYGISNNILHDELIADFMGIYDAFGAYKAEWFLRFMGIVEGGGSRLAVYTDKLSPNVKKAVSEAVRVAAYGLESWSQSESFKEQSASERIKYMCRIGIAGMAELLHNGGN